MDIGKYFKNLTIELESLKDRVRHYIKNNHWQSDGEWKESVLRTVLKRHLPKNIGVGRGFIANIDHASTQIDVLLYDNSKPILFQDGDFVIITPDTAKGIIEVKTKIRGKKDLRTAINKISEIAELTNPTPGIGKDQFFGLFSYEDCLSNHDVVLEILQKCVNGQRQRVVNCISLGKHYFVRYWPTRPAGQFSKWHSYHLENKAPAYFIHNVIDHLSPKWASDNIDVWYPEDGKENHKTGEIILPLPHQITD